MHSEMTVKEYQMRLALYDHLILLYEENKLPKKDDRVYGNIYESF